jgi:hypothetical protein
MLTVAGLAQSCASDDPIPQTFCSGYLMGAQVAFDLDGTIRECPAITGSELRSAANVFFRNQGQKLLADTDTASAVDGLPFAVGLILVQAGCKLKDK